MRKLVGLAAVLVWVTTASAQIFTDDFDDTMGEDRWSTPFFSSELVPPVFDGNVNYQFDYSTLGIPAAPHTVGGTTVGLGLQSNITDQPVDEGEALGVSPLIGSLPADYVITADVFMYYGSGGGSSEHSVIGINSDRSGIAFAYKPADTVGVSYAIPHNSGTGANGTDYARGADGTYTSLWGDDSSGLVDDPEVLGIPFVGDDPVFNDPGFAGNRWFSLELSTIGNIVTLKIEGVVIDQYDNSGGTTSGDIFVGVSDMFNSVNTTNWTVWDNIVVDVPEPASLVLIALAALALRRR